VSTTLHTAAPFWVMGLAALSVSLAVVGMRQFGPKLLFNPTPSEPRGIYRLVSHPTREYRRGMVVVFAVPPALRALVYGRRWLPDGVPLLKELKGLAGDRVCILPDHLEVNDRIVGPVYSQDRRGLPLPRVRGCFGVAAGDFFAASEHLPNSFDARYFGSLPLSVLQGEAKPLWTF